MIFTGGGYPMKHHSPELYRYAAGFLAALVVFHGAAPVSAALAATGAPDASESSKNTDSYTVGDFVIEIEKVSVPASAGALFYTGKEQAGADLPDLGTRYRVVSGNVSAVKPGDYAFTLELCDPLSEDVLKKIAAGASASEQSNNVTPEQYVPATPSEYMHVRYRTWNDGSTAPKTVSWSISALKTATPEGKKLTYTGKEQTGVDASSDNSYSVTGNKAMKAGEYKAELRLTEGHVWEDGSTVPKTVAWSISALKTEIPEGKKLTYTGKEQTGVDASSDNSYTITGNKATKTGEYKALLRLTEGHVWADGSTADKEIAWSIKRSSGSSSGGSGGSGGSSGTGISAVKVVRPDGTTSVYGNTGSTGSYTQGGSVISPSASGNTAAAPSGTGLVQASPGTPSPAPAAAPALPAQSKLPQSSSTKENPPAQTKPAAPVSSVKQPAGNVPEKENTEKAMTPEIPETSAAEKETMAEENDHETSVTFEFLAADNETAAEPMPAVQDAADTWNPQSLAGVLLKSVLLLAGFGTAGALIWQTVRKHRNDVQ